MLNQRRRAVVLAITALVGIWAVATAGYFVAKHLKVTAEKVRAYVATVDLSKLSAAERAQALNKLASQFNSLSLEERRQLRLENMGERWFQQITEAEKTGFIDATMPTGIKQMLTGFEELPPDKRQRAVDEAIMRLRQNRGRMGAGVAPGSGGSNAPPLSPQLEEKVREIGLKSFYSQSSAQTKAELAPLLEELQNAMQSGSAFRGGRR